MIENDEAKEIQARDDRAAEMHRIAGTILDALRGMPRDSVERVLNATCAAYDIPLPFPDRVDPELAEKRRKPRA